MRKSFFFFLFCIRLVGPYSKLFLNSLRKRRAIFRQLHHKTPLQIFSKRLIVLILWRMHGAINGVAKFISAMAVNIVKVLLFYLILNLNSKLNNKFNDDRRKLILQIKQGP